MEWEPSPIRVLIVEDDGLIAWALATLIDEAGCCACGIARDPEAALRSAERERPDVAVVDINLARGTDGIEAAKELRRRWNIPAIIVSANLDAANRERAAEVDPVALIDKPYRPSQVLQALECCRIRGQ